MCRVLLVVLACACGRVGFDERNAGGDGGSSALALSYPTTHVAAVVNASTVSLTPTVSEPARFAIAPALPAGLTLDATTGVIAGVPTASADAAYVITATAGADSATWPLELIALPGYIVDSTVDQPDASGGADAICAATSGGCTLRAAIQTTNQRASRQLVLLGTATYSLGSALDAITNDVVIAGAGATASTIRAEVVHANYPAFALAGAHTLALRDLAIDDFGGSDGGALAVTAGTLDVDRCDFDNNASPTSGGVLFINGGASATLARCTFTGNASLGGNGGGWGGVIDGEGTGTTIVVTRSFATKNTTAWGSFSHITSGTTLRLENSTLYANTSTTAGTLATPGGIYTLVNDTITGNINTGGDSAGIYLFSAPCHYTVTNTIVAANVDQPGGEQDCNIRDLSTTITSGGGNILGDAGGNCAQYFNDPTDRASTDPGLAAAMPADHGGTTLTMLLGSGSPALDTGVAGACPAVDQRDLPRPQGAGCDIGAVEMQP